LNVVYAASEQDVRQAMTRWNRTEEQVRGLLKHEWKRDVPEFAFPATEELFVPLGETRPSRSDTAPDISGTWIAKSMTLQDQKVSVSIPMEIRRIRSGNIDFLVDQPWVEQATRINMRWNAAGGWFTGSYTTSDNTAGKMWLRPSDDVRTLHVFVRIKPADGEVTTSEQEWSLKSKTISTEFNPDNFGEAFASTIPSLEPKPDHESSPIPEPFKSSRSKSNRRSVPASAEARQVFERLQAEESAAGSEADLIRQLQTNGQAEQNRQAIAEHQRKLTNLLGTAFDLKLQLEELQVKELQARLSQLDRQIGQRKQLREKIISRRATELIDGDALKWNSVKVRTDKSSDTAATSSPPDDGTVKNILAAPTARTEEVTVDLYGGSGVLPGMNKLPAYSRLVQSLNGLKGVVTNIRVAGEGTSIALAIVRDPSRRCQRETQRTQKESELRIAINAALKEAGIENFRWEENEDSIEAVRATRTGNEATFTQPQNFDPPPSSDELQAELNPFVERVTDGEARVRSLQDAYFQDRSSAPVLQAALDELEQARTKLQRLVNDAGREVQFLERESDSSEAIAKALGEQWLTRVESLSQDHATEADVKSANDAYARASALAIRNATRFHDYLTVWEAVPFPGHRDWMTAPFAPSDKSQLRFHPDVAIAWLEATTGQKLEFVRLDGLKLPVTAALRVSEKSSRLEKGDLLVNLDGYRFESLDQAVTARRNGQHGQFSTFLRGGLGGRASTTAFGRASNDTLVPTEAGKALVNFQLRVRRKAGDDIETLYVNGVCVSMDGLVVIPVAASSLLDDARVVTYLPFKGTAKIVASDEQRGLTLVKLDVPGQPLFRWVACQTSLPTRGQRLHIFEKIGSDFRETTIVKVDLDYPEPLTGKDAFAVDDLSGAPVGSPLMSIEDELQGILLTTSLFAPGEPERGLGHVVPAVHVEKLLTDYRAKPTLAAAENVTIDGDRPDSPGPAPNP